MASLDPRARPQAGVRRWEIHLPERFDRTRWIVGGGVGLVITLAVAAMAINDERPIADAAVSQNMIADRGDAIGDAAQRPRQSARSPEQSTAALRASAAQQATEAMVAAL